MKYTHIIWDFNGTLLDDVQTGIKSINTLLRRRSLPTVDSIEQYHNAFTFPIKEYYKNVGFDLEVYPFDTLAVEWITENQENIKKAPLLPGAKEALCKFKKHSIPQIMISATKLDMLRGHVKALGIYDYFDEILGLDNINAESKVRLGRDWTEQHPDAVPLMIGDTIHDAEVAHEIGCDCLLVASGHQSAKILFTAGVPVMHDLGEVLNYLKI